MGKTFEFDGFIKGGLSVKVEAYFYPYKPTSYFHPSISSEIEIVKVKFHTGHEFTKITNEIIDTLQEQGFEFLRDEAITYAEYRSEER